LGLGRDAKGAIIRAKRKRAERRKEKRGERKAGAGGGRNLGESLGCRTLYVMTRISDLRFQI